MYLEEYAVLSIIGCNAVASIQDLVGKKQLPRSFYLN